MEESIQLWAVMTIKPQRSQRNTDIDVPVFMHQACVTLAVEAEQSLSERLFYKIHVRAISAWRDANPGQSQDAFPVIMYTHEPINSVYCARGFAPSPSTETTEVQTPGDSQVVTPQKYTGPNHTTPISGWPAPRNQ